MATNSPPLTTSLNETIAVIAYYGQAVGAPLTMADIEYQLSHYHESRVGGLIAGTVVMMVASTIAVAMRLISRRIKKAKYGADDFMAFLGLILFYVYSASFFVIIHYGLGLHSFRAGACKFERIGKPFYVFQCLYGPVCLTTKLSILLLYRRVFTITSKAWSICFWTLTGLFTVWTLGVFFKDIFEAVPIRAVWTVVPGAKWIDVIPAFLSTAIINVILTTALLILPMPLIWTMNMSKEKRLGLCALFAIGCGDVVAIIVRCVTLANEKYPNTDFSWTVMPSAILSIIEQALGILCASLPMSRALIIRVFFPKRHISSYPLNPQKFSPNTSSGSSNKQKGFRNLPEDETIGTMGTIATVDDDKTSSPHHLEGGMVPYDGKGKFAGEPLETIISVESSPDMSRDRQQSTTGSSNEVHNLWNPISSHTTPRKDGV